MQPHQAPIVSSHENSQFFKRLDAVAKAQSTNIRLGNLCTATQSLLQNAKAIATQVNQFLPQFTLHDDVHLWNVLSFMEELAGGEAEIQKLGAGDCAMAIWAAFTHDLGMVLEAGELAALDAVDDYDTAPDKDSPPPKVLSDERAQAWRAYRDGHEHWSKIRQDPDPKSPASRMRLGIIRAAYIRDSHAREDARTGHCRIADWLEFIAEKDRLLAQALDDFSVAERLVRVAVSHNQDIQWLPRQLQEQLGVKEPYAEPMGADLGTIHWTWIGWLLRLADVFDCDKSRTPKVLFEHGGITDERSQTEWQKHLAIAERPMWATGNDSQTLIYTSQRCPSPVVEKAIHQIVGWMNDEIDKVKNARLATISADPLPTLNLPSRALVKILKREGGYLYHDMEFRLDRDAVVELLMGESLYGGPELALRELVQNALDAVHLRDQRNQLAIALKRAGGKEKPRQPHESWDGQEPGVEVTWGFDESKKRNFVRVADNGVGMTVGTMRRFLTQIGKSYYKSDDFRAEQELMRRNGILCTAISQFGIGFLSVFMLADEVTIHTRPVSATHEIPPADETLQATARFPFRAEIHGPHGLLTFYPDNSVRLPGTTVTIWLKDKFVFSTWDREALLAQLRGEFYEGPLPESVIKRQNLEVSVSGVNNQHLDPGFEISRFILWPLYPVKLSAQSSHDPLVIDDTFHQRELIPLDLVALKAKADGWGHAIPEIQQTDWCVCDWTDEHTEGNGIEGTGTRIRLIAAQPEAKSKHFTPAEWAAFTEYLPSGQPRILLGCFTEPQLPRPMTRYQCLVNGVRIVPGYVPSFSERDCRLPDILESLPMLPGAGGWVWIDLRGAAMPRLRADRSAPIAMQHKEVDWSSLWQRWLNAWPTLQAHWLTAGFMSRQLWRFKSQSKNSRRRLGLHFVSPQLVSELWSMELELLNNIDVLPKEQSSRVARDSGRGLSELRYKLDFDGELDRDFARTLNRALDRARALDLALAHDLTRNTHGVSKVARDLARDFAQDTNTWKGRLITEMVQSHFASEALGAPLSDSHPVIGLTTDASSPDEMQLAGPLQVEPYNGEFPTENWLTEYDLVIPYTAFPNRLLRKKLPEFRRYRAVYMLPFLIGQEPLEDWREILKENRPFDSLVVFLPNPAHWEWLFDEHSREDWSEGSASAFWDLKTGVVLYADGIHTERSIRKEGKPLLEWLRG